MSGRIAGFAAAFLFASAMAADVPVQAAREIEHLLGYLAASGCDFNRNGDWHPASDARTHLEKKYRYLVKKGLVQKTEDFITLGATQSSMSRTPYQVRCHGQALPSAEWLGAELRRYRESPKQ